MFYAGMSVPTWMLVALAASVVVASAGATILQARYQRALAATGAAVVAVIVVGIAAATRLRAGSGVRLWLESAIPQAIMYGLPALTALITVVALRRCAAWQRITWGLVFGAGAAFVAMGAGLAVACGLTGDCL